MAIRQLLLGDTHPVNWVQQVRGLGHNGRLPAFLRSAKVAVSFGEVA